MVDAGDVRQSIPGSLIELINRVATAFVSLLSLWALMWLYAEGFREPYQALSIIVGLLAILLFRGIRTSDFVTSRNTWAIVVSVTTTWLLMSAILLALGYATKSSGLYSRKLLFTWFLVTPPLLVIAEITLQTVLTKLLRNRSTTRNAVIAGANELGRTLFKRINSASRAGMNVLGFFDDRSEERLGNLSGARLLGRLAELPKFVKSQRVDVIFIALPMRNIKRVTELLDQLHDTTVSIYFVPDVFVFDLIQCRTGNVGGLPVVSLCETPYYGTRGITKRVSDFIIASLALIILSPLLIAIAICIKLTSPGPVIFKQRRYGLDGQEITVYKFRTMNVLEDGDVIRQATVGDRRITKFGAFLRKHSLDELPQFVNVLQGRMSVVGPRPHAIAHNEEYRRLIKGYMIRHKVNPGITGLAQVKGHRGETETVDAMAKRIECDLEYLRNWSLGMDIKIIFKTAVLILTDRKAY